MVENLSFLNWGFKPEKIPNSSNPYVWIYAYTTEEGENIECDILSFPTLQTLLKTVWSNLWLEEFEHIFDEPWEYTGNPYDPIYIYSEGDEVGPLLLNGLLLNLGDDENIIGKYLSDLTVISAWLGEDEEMNEDNEWENYDAQEYKEVSQTNFNNWVDNSEYLKNYSNALETASFTQKIQNQKNSRKHFLIGELGWNSDWSNNKYKFYYKP